MGNGYNGVIVAGNEHNKADTIRILASAVKTADTLIGSVVGNGMYDNADAIANTPAYMEAVEVLALYLVEMVKTKNTKTEEVPVATEDEDEDDADDEDEDADDEDEDAVCDRCGAVIPEDEDGGDYLVASNEYVCYDCMTAKEYLNSQKIGDESPQFFLG